MYKCIALVCLKWGAPHLRHTHATLLLKANIHPKIVADRLGPSDIKMTLNTYSHILPDMQQQAVDELNKIMKIN